jgi:hypothetical protein
MKFPDFSDHVIPVYHIAKVQTPAIAAAEQQSTHPFRHQGTWMDPAQAGPHPIFSSGSSDQEKTKDVPHLKSGFRQKTALERQR